MVALRLAMAVLLLAASSATTLADGKVIRPRSYQGSLQEKSQEAIIVFHEGENPGEAIEDLILKTTVVGEVDNFAWVVPFPSEPETKQEDAALFKELFDYVEARRVRRNSGTASAIEKAEVKSDSPAAVEVLSRRIVGSYDLAIVKEKEKGKLNAWLEAEGFHPLDGGEDVIEFYRNKGYVFSCIKVAATELAESKQVDLHPLRFTFKTGGRDGIYFPMRMTGLQSEPFDVNLYVFFRFWLNDECNAFGYVHRGMQLKYRDWDTAQCIADGGKAWSAPQTAPLLKELAYRVPTVASFFQKSYPGDRFYLTNISADGLKPADVRDWSDDLWLFPAYRGRFVPHDARPGGVAAAAYKHVSLNAEDESQRDENEDYYDTDEWRKRVMVKVGTAAAAMLALVGIAWLVIRATRPK